MAYRCVFIQEISILKERISGPQEWSIIYIEQDMFIVPVTCCALELYNQKELGRVSLILKVGRKHGKITLLPVRK